MRGDIFGQQRADDADVNQVENVRTFAQNLCQWRFEGAAQGCFFSQKSPKKKGNAEGQNQIIDHNAQRRQQTLSSELSRQVYKLPYACN